MSSPSKFWSGRRVLITGISGFVGANLSRALLDAGADVAGLDLLTASPSLRALDVEVPILKRDIRDDGRLAWALMNGNGELGWWPPEVIVHLAGVGHISQAQRDPMTAWQVNVQGTWNLLEACRSLPAGQLKAVVLASSNHVFGSLNPGAVPAGTPYPAVRQDSARTAWLEDDPCGATDVYGVSKGCVDLLARAYAEMGVPVVALRHVNAFGPGDPHRSHLVTGTICDLLEGKTPVIRGDGTPIKGYVHVRDAVSAYLILAHALAEGRVEPGRHSYNAGAPAPISVLALVDTLIQLCQLDMVPEVLGEDLSQSGYVEHLLSYRLEALGWEAGDLHEDLARTVAWYRDKGGMAWTS